MEKRITIAVVDTETTGVGDADRMVEFGCSPVYACVDDVIHDKSDWSDIGLGHGRLINPSMPIPISAMAIHHITDNMVARHGVAPDAAVDFVMKTAGVSNPAYIAAHNMDFDWRFLSGFLSGDIKRICTYKVALILYPDAPNHKNATLYYYLDLHKSKRGLSDDFFSNCSLHRALPDAVITSYVLRAMMLRLSLVDMVEISAAPALMPRCNFGNKHNGEKWADIPKGYLEWITDKIDDKPDVLYAAQRELVRRARGDQHSSHPQT